MKQSILEGDRRSLAKALTLIESQKPEHQVQAQNLITELLPYSGKSFRLGISGPPGVGKSTFIEGFGNYLIEKHQKKVAVLAVDPSSPISGGSLLADKTRMQTLSQSPMAFIRPSPSAGALGGVAHKTRECMLLCEAAGFEYILIETVGVGQSEFEVANMVDFLMTLMLPNSGDEIQGIKKGLIEITDAIVVNKWDGDLKIAAETSASQYKLALSILSRRSDWEPQVLLCSSQESKGFEEVFKALQKFEILKKNQGNWEKDRENQNLLWLDSLLKQRIESYILSRHSDLWKELREKVRHQQMTPFEAAEHLFQQL